MVHSGAFDMIAIDFVFIGLLFILRNDWMENRERENHGLTEVNEESTVSLALILRHGHDA